ncbi:unnamed protein product [Mytilus coruscus]|uniref:Tyr recombinase domain-containing protein n=1 Tax=Mytilus coruscus TaxID=42192 RepID=A0A6J8BT13_MYTCO|nr:unnamed protein product [Mytilus coruscus]
MVVKLAPKKVANIVELCRTLLMKCFVTIREFAQLIGKLVASEHGVLYAPVFYKTLEIQKDVELKLNKGNFDARIILSNESKQCINWWIENIHDSYKPIVFKLPDRKIESDSSMLGYGALDVTNNLTLSGVWSLSERNKHINFLELKAAFLALKAFCDRTRNEHFPKPYKPVKKGTIAKWIKQVLILAGIDMTIFTPHSTRGAATSYVSGRIPIATILRTAGWRKDSVFRKFYQRPITNDSSFSKEILLIREIR